MFAIYFPGKTGATVDHFREAGLQELLDDVSPSFTDLSPGPDGAPGLAATWSPGPIVSPALEWTPRRGGKFWFGKTSGEKLAPADLARRERQLGADVTLADGQAWHIPIARQLPQLLGLDDDGRLKPQILPLYQDFWELAWQATDWFRADDHGMCWVDFRACFDFVVRALSINYRVNGDVATWLALVRSDSCWPVAEAVTDGLWGLAQKKTPNVADTAANGEPPTSAGAAA